MRVLWVCNIMLPHIAKLLGQEVNNKEGWITGLLGGVIAHNASMLQSGNMSVYKMFVYCKIILTGFFYMTFYFTGF